MQTQSTCFHTCSSIARNPNYCSQTAPPVACEINIFRDFESSAQQLPATNLTARSVHATSGRLRPTRTADSSRSSHTHTKKNFLRQNPNKELRFQNNNRTTENQQTRRNHYGVPSQTTLLTRSALYTSMPTTHSDPSQTT